MWSTNHHREPQSMDLGDLVVDVGYTVNGVPRCLDGFPRPCVFCSRVVLARDAVQGRGADFLWFALGPNHPAMRCWW